MIEVNVRGYSRGVPTVKAQKAMSLTSGGTASCSGGYGLG